jgi:hypothetical protein
MKREKIIVVFFLILSFVTGNIFSQTAITDFTHHANIAHAEPEYNTSAGEPQYVHSSTQTVYMLPGGATKTLSAVTNGMTYYRWYRSDIPFNEEQTNGGITNATSDNVLSTTTGTSLYRKQDKGFIYYNAAGLSNTNGLSVGQTITAAAPSNLSTAYPLYVSCDVSNFSDGTGNIDFKEPTLSFRNHFEIRPAWEIARAIDSTLLLNTTANNNHAYEVIRLMAPVGGSNNDTYTHLRLSTKFAATNYYYENSALDATLANTSTANSALASSTTLYWVRRSTTSDIQTVRNTFFGTAITASPNVNNSGSYSFPNSGSGAVNTDHHILEIVTGGSSGRTAGTIDYYDVYAGNGTNSRKVARFIITYVNRDTPTTSTVYMPFGTGPRIPAPIGARSIPDILNVVQNKKEIAYKSFDQPETSYLHMGSVPLSLDASSYGFDDPYHFATTDNVFAAYPQTGSTNSTFPGTHHSNLCAFYSEYSFPQAVRGGITGAANGASGGAAANNPYSWYSGAGISIYDRTYVNTGGEQYASSPTSTATLGNFMYIDASAASGTFVTLSINEAMCPGTELYFSAWMLNLNSSSGTSSSSSVRPDLIFILKDSLNNEITRFYTGDFGRGSTAADIHKWYEIAFSFMVPEGYSDPNHATEFLLEIVNNGLSNSGNDFALDEIKIWRKNPSVIAIRTNPMFCRPEEINTGDPLVMKIDVNVSNLRVVAALAINDVYLRFKDAENKPFPSSYSNGTHDIYENQGINDGIAYGHFDLDALPTLPVGSTNLITHLEDVPNGEGGLTETHLVFYQLIPNDIYNVINDEGLGDYSIIVAETVAGLENPRCNGECIFTVRYDEADFSLKVQGEIEVLSPYEIYICSSQKVELITNTHDYATDKAFYAYSDWYHGPIHTYVPVDETEQETSEYDQYLNHIGVYERKIFDENNSVVEDGLSGDYSVWNDIMAYRHFFPYATEKEINGVGVNAPTKWPLKETAAIYQIDSKDKEGSDSERFFDNAATPSTGNIIYGITFNNLTVLHNLLERVDYYVKNNIITLYSRTLAVSFNSIAPYFYTILPVSPTWEMDEDGGCIDPDESNATRNIDICTSPAQLRVQATAWGPEVEFGEVTDEGLPAKDYRSVKANDYIHTVRLPETFLDGSKPDLFVIPMLYMDEVHLAKMELVKVNDSFLNTSGATYLPPENTSLDDVEGYKLSNIHLGVINDGNDEKEKNKLDTENTIIVTQTYSDEGYSLPLDEPTSMKTYWSLLDDRLSPDPSDAEYAGLKLLESYPLIFGQYNYYNPDFYPNHTLEREGDPYPIGTYTVALPSESTTDIHINKNKIALEIPASAIPDVYRGGATSFKPGFEYLFRFTCTSGKDWSNLGNIDVCSRSFYFRLKIVPDTLVWTPPTTGDLAGNDSWHKDELWKNYNSGQTPTNGFVPLRVTHVILPEGAPIYPTLKNDTIANWHTWDSPDLGEYQTPDVLATKYIEYDYNFEPDVASVIHFKNGSELGRQDYLTYDSAKVDLNLQTMRWYGISAPLRQMYSGDYAFERANPLAHMRLFNEKNPQSHEAATLDWTEQFSTANHLLEAGTGFSYRIGQLVLDLEDGLPADPDHSHIIADTTLYFPKTKMSFPFYNEITKMPTGKVDNLLSGGRDHSMRFVYETDTHQAPADPLVTVPAKTTTTGALVVVGNPFMSHLDFAEFYEVNKERIEPKYHLLESGSTFNVGQYVSFVLEGSVSSAGLTAISIPPMQTFIVEIKSGYNGSDLEITRAMSTVDNAHSALRSSVPEPAQLLIKVSRDNLSTSAVVAFSDRAHNEYAPNEDSRRILSSQLINSPSVFTITDGMYLDINQLRDMPESLPIGISTAGKGMTRITFTGSSSLPATYDYFFFDNQTSQKIPISENRFYEFDNTDGDQIGRFYILSELRTPNRIDELQGNLQIYVSRGTVHVLSSDGSEIENVKIYGPDGSALYMQANTGRSHVEIPITQSNPVLIVKATAGRTTKTEKVIVKN